MSVTNKGHIGVGGVWKDVNERYIGVDSAWKKEKFRFIGKDGRWELVYSDTLVNTNDSFYITHLNGYEVNRSNVLTVYGSGFTTAPGITPQSGAMYTLETNTADSFGNFSSGTIIGTTNFVTLDSVDGYQIVSDGDYFQPSINPTTGFSQLGLVGNDGTKDYTLSGWFYIPDTLTIGSGEEIPIVSIGERENGFDLIVDEFYALNQKIYLSASSTEEIKTANNSVVTGWNQFVIDRNAGTTNIRMNGDMTVLASSTTLTLAPTSSSDEIRVGSLLSYTESTTSPRLSSAKVHGSYTLSNNDRTITKSTINNYESARGNNIMSINTGKYYFEVLINTTGESNWVGIAEPTSPVSDAVGIAGWSASSLSRTFDRESGGGTVWGGGANGWTTGDVIGVIYDSDAGTVTYYKNNTLLGTPAFTGITGDVEPMIAGVNGIQLTTQFAQSEFTYSLPSGCQVLPDTTSYINPTYTSTPNIAFKNIYLYGSAQTTDNINKLLSSGVGSLYLFNTNTSTEILLDNQWELDKTDSEINFTIPTDITYGNYEVYLKSPSLETLHLPFKIVPPIVRVSAFDDDLSNPKTLNNNYLVMNSQWGGANGGVVPQNVRWENGEIVFTANGDRYTGNVQGVNSDGTPKTHTDPSDPEFGNPWTNRVGGCISLNKKTGFGSYEITTKIPNQLGVAYAMWTFFYNELYPADPQYSQFQDTPTLDGSFNRIGGGEGLHESGNATDGYYIVRNHEIDIEFPSHVGGGSISDPSLSNCKINTWRGELSNTAPGPGDPAYYKEFDVKLHGLGSSIADGAYHKLRFDWYFDRVEFYIDDVLLNTTTNADQELVIPDIPGFFTFGMWFPSSPLSGSPWLVDPNAGWAGGVVDPDGGQKADFDTVEMRVSRVKYTPFTSEINNYQRPFGETYPFDTYLRIRK
jgi:hypothetical protein